MALETIAAVGFSAVGAGIGAYGSLYQGAATSAAADYNAALMARNAGIARDQARADAEDKQREARRYLGSLHAAFGASGLAIEGSALDVYEDQAAESALAVQRVLYGGELRAAGLEAGAELEKMKSETATTAGYLGAAAQVVGGVGTYYRLRRGIGNASTD